MRTVGSFAEVWEAHLLRGRLMSEDIPAFVTFPFHVGNAWHYGLALGGVKVQVPNGFEDEAAAVFARTSGETYRDELEYELGPIPHIHCPHCGAARWKKVRPWYVSILAVAVVIVVFGFAILPDDRPLKCRVCGTVWDPGPYL